MTSSKWFVCPKPNPSAKTRLFIFPYAGGSPAAFGAWTVENIESRIAHYPGRGSRFNEPPIKRIDALVENLLREIQPALDKPFAFFGHSLGGLIAFELARSLRRFSLPQPARLFLSACAAPHMPGPHPPIHALPEDEFLQEAKKFNGIPAEILNHPEALTLLLPILRADFEAAETYRGEVGEPLACPIHAFGGLEDTDVSRERLEGWALHTTAAFTSRYFRGDHFFISAYKDAIIESIVAEL